ncbi:hypothetical protein RhiJN_10657 [Ceratobasidium sp. AG-Ba]|nr:hypothetical protein RhiJN_10657 [Ceratobasidium sp. AG-Ba]QRW11397.1 hypothetical protein RhiLY_10396 [Ceratobasidium sp. AG-Ba]
MSAVDELLLRVGAAFPSTEPQDMHTYATKAPSQPFLKEVLDITQSISDALVTMPSVNDSKVISILREQANHDQIVFERQDLNRRAVELLEHQTKHWVEDIPLDPERRPDFILSSIERWGKDAKMEVYQSIENGLNSIACAGSAVVLDLLFKKSEPNVAVPTITLVSLKSSYPTSSESAPVAQPLATVEKLLASGVTAYIDEVLRPESDAQKAAQLAMRVIEHIRYIMSLDAQAAREAEAGDTGARWFAEVGLLSPKVVDLGCKEAAGLCSQLKTEKAPLDIFLRRAHGLPLVNLNSPSISFLIGIPPLIYLSLLKASALQPEPPSSDTQPNIDVSIPLLRRFVTQHPTPPGITTCNLILSPCSQLDTNLIHPHPSRPPQFTLLDNTPIPSLEHNFPVPGGNSAWVLDFGAKGLVMRRSAMQTLVQTLGHIVDVDVALSGMGFLNLGMGLMNEESRGWVSMLLQRPLLSTSQQLYAVQKSPSQKYPPVQVTLRLPPESGFVLGRVRVRDMAEVWTTLEIVREQCWLNSMIASYDWHESPPKIDEPEPQGISSLQSGQFFSIPTQMTLSVGAAPPSVLLQFPIPSRGSVPPIVQFMVSYDSTATRGTRVQFGSLDPKLSVADTLDVYKDQLDEVFRRAGPLAAVGWINAQLRPS